MSKGEFDKHYTTRKWAIRLKCMDCTGYQTEEIRSCTVTNCPLYPFRQGKNPSFSDKKYIKVGYTTAFEMMQKNHNKGDLK